MIPVKFGMRPGDIPKKDKIAMMEGRYEYPTYILGIVNLPPPERLAKAFRREVRMKTRAVLKRRTRKEIEDQMDLHPK